MDEEDGRLGPPPGHIIGNLLIDVTGGRTQQPGRDDVLTDADMKSLRHQSINLLRVLELGCPIHFAQFAKWVGYHDSSCLIWHSKNSTQHEVNHENVPGK